MLVFKLSCKLAMCYAGGQTLEKKANCGKSACRNNYWGRIQNMDPRSTDHHCGPRPWTPSWTRSMDYPCGPPLLLYSFKQKNPQMKKISHPGTYLDNLSNNCCLLQGHEKCRMLQGDSNPWHLRCRCNALPTELWSQSVGSKLCFAYVVLLGPFWPGLSYATLLHVGLDSADRLAQAVEHRTQMDQNSGSSNNWGENAAFVMTFAND